MGSDLRAHQLTFVECHLVSDKVMHDAWGEQRAFSPADAPHCEVRCQAHAATEGAGSGDSAALKLGADEGRLVLRSMNSGCV